MEEEVLFSYLRSSLWGTELEEKSNIDYNQLLETAKKLSVYQLVADIILKKKKDALTKEQIEDIENKMEIYDLTYQYFNSILLKLLDYLNCSGIYPILLKGQGLAAFYNNPKLRDCGDIDLYVGEDNYRHTIELCLKKSNKNTDTKECLKHFSLHIGKINVEIHRVSAILPTKKQNEIYSAYENKYIRNSTNKVNIAGTDVTIPETTFNLLFTFLHAHHHFIAGGLGLRHLCDIAVYLDKNFTQIDKERLLDMLNSLSLFKAWQLFMNVLVDYIGLNPDKTFFYEKVNPRKVKRMIQLIFLEGNFGHYREDRTIIKKNIDKWLLRKTLVLYFETKRSIKLFGIFPENAIREYISLLKTGFGNLINSLKPGYYKH